MDTDRMTAIYQVLEEAKVTLPPDPQGPHLLQTKLQECRTWQDTIIALSMEVLRATAAVKKGLRAAKAALPLLPKGTPNFIATQGELHTLEDRLDDLRALEQSVRVVRNNLKATDSDIRLHAHLIDQQIRLGAVQPPPQPPTPAPPSPHAAAVPAAAVAQTFDPAAAPYVKIATGPGGNLAAALANPAWFPAEPQVSTPPIAPATPSAPVLQQPVTTVDVVDINAFLGGSK